MSKAATTPIFVSRISPADSILSVISPVLSPMKQIPRLPHDMRIKQPNMAHFSGFYVMKRQKTLAMNSAVSVESDR